MRHTGANKMRMQWKGLLSLTGRLIKWEIASLLVVFCAACSTGPTIHNKEFPPAQPETEVRLGPGDTIDIKFLFWPELNDEEPQIVRPDGKISLQLVGDVYVAGLTPDQLDEQLTRMFASKIKDPEITVIVRALIKQQVYVGGEVRAPGVVPMPNRMTVLEAVIAAGGFDKDSAELSNIVIVRRAGDKLLATSFDLKKELGKPEQEPFYLAAQDIILVPPTRIHTMNKWIQQYITKMIPDTSLTLLYRPNDRTTIGVAP